jgi:hypothetical protein
MHRTSATLNIRRRLITMASVLALAAGTATAATAQEASGPKEGITVHGHWIIEVRNPDGTVSTRREFENALVAPGAGALSLLLAQQAVPGTWFVWIGANPCIRLGNPTGCAMTNAYGAQGGVPTEFFPSLTVTAPTSGPNAGKVVFEGTATATNPAPSAINSVLTQLWMCPPTMLTGAGCRSAGVVQANFTQATVTPAIPLVSGQIIQVTVIISFS